MISVHSHKHLALIMAPAHAAMIASSAHSEASKVTLKEIIPFRDTLTAYNRKGAFASTEFVIFFHVVHLVFRIRREAGGKL